MGRWVKDSSWRLALTSLNTISRSLGRSSRPREEAIAFGPYLALAGFVYLLAGDTVLSFYLPAGVL